MRQSSFRGMKPSQLTAAFSLLEVLVVMAIIAVFFGLAIPAVARVRDVAARMNCASNLRQLAMAVHLFSDSRHQLPRGCDYPFVGNHDRWLFYPGLSWQTSILPHIEQSALWNEAWAAHIAAPHGDGPRHIPVRGKTVSVFRCPSESRQVGSNGLVTWGLTSYVGVAGTTDRWKDGVMHNNYSVRFRDITDGTSNTVMLGERVPGPGGNFGAWYGAWGYSVCSLAQILPGGRTDWIPPQGVDCPIRGSSFRLGQADNACDVNHFWSRHINGANFALVDGSVRFLTYASDVILPALATRAGGEIIELP